MRLCSKSNSRTETDRCKYQARDGYGSIPHSLIRQQAVAYVTLTQGLLYIRLSEMRDSIGSKDNPWPWQRVKDDHKVDH